MSGGIQYSHLDARGSVLSRVHYQSQKPLGIVDRPIEPQTIAHFLTFALGGADLPNGKKTSLELLKESDMELLHSSPETDDDPRPIIARVTARIGSFEDSGRLCMVGKNIHAVKSRAWAGIVPLSEQRWKEKGLDKPENFDLAAQHLSSVIAAFEYLNTPKIMENMRDTFNLIAAHWGEFDSMIHAQDASRRGVSTRKLWTEFMAAQFEMMTERAHRWVLLHANALRLPLQQQVLAHRPESLQQYDRTQWWITDRLHMLMELVSVADFTILMPMEGYDGYTSAPVPSEIPGALRSTKLAERRDAYGRRLKELSRRAQAEAEIERMQQAAGTYRTADPTSIARTSVMQIECQNRVRREVRGEPVEPIPREPWIVQDLRRLERPDNEQKAIGFVIYRLTYGQSEAEWAAFRKKLDEHMADWGRGQTGSSALKPFLKLHWRDGKELGIPEDDIVAARKHYDEHYEDPLPINLVDTPGKRAFLVIDTASYASYTGNTYTSATDLVLPGDHTGFILAVDGDYNEEEGGAHYRPDESPGYMGHMRMLGSLIWGDLYAMLSSQSAILEDLWPLATEHPNQVYVGPTVPLQIKGWRIQNGIRGMLMRTVSEYAKAKVEGRPWPLSSGSTSTTAPAPAPAPTPVSQPTRPAQPPGPTAPPPETTPDPARNASALENDLRTFMLFGFTRWLRDRGQQREAIMAEELMRVPAGQTPDLDNVHRRMVLEGVLDEDDLRDAARRRANGEDGGRNRDGNGSANGNGNGNGDRNGDGNGNGNGDPPFEGCPTQ
ncbi:hypothetical protein BJX68DRAFT_239393 [Aspergillus pseudodeflectus]|uniref:Uncharacterized protein n=1 Tax=Aspergillus pseudodeflectus TaxID=176178 RepID=A0ABR4K5L1_9EURO